MHVWYVLHVARWKYRMQKIAKNSPSGHHHNIIRLYLRNEGIYRQSEKKLVKQQYLLLLPQYGRLWPSNGWDRFDCLGHPRKFQRVSHLAFVTAATSLTGGQPNFARCLAISWAGILYIHFLGCCSSRKFAWCKIHFTSKSCVLLYC